MDGTPTHCAFEHAGFAALGTPVFRLTQGDRIAAMTLRIDTADVVVPLPAVVRLFGLKPESADSQMLHLVEQSLRFVTALNLGDPLPSEVTTGEASWVPHAYHRKAAAAKLQLHLVQWIGGAADIDDANLTPHMLIAAVHDPAIRSRVEEGLRRAAGQLGLESGAAVASLIEEAAEEMSYFEALREWLMDRVHAIAKRLVRFTQEAGAVGAARRETLLQVVRLALTAELDLSQTFEAVDPRTADIIQMLQNREQHRIALRPQRDRLYTALLAWEPLLKAWDNVLAAAREPDSIWRVIDESYRFLAPRYMPVHEWQPVPTGDKAERARAPLVW